MAQRHDSVDHRNFPLELGAHRGVLVVIRWLVALEGAVGEDQVAILAEGLQRGNQLRVVEFVQGGVDFAVVLFGFGEKRENRGPEEAAEGVSQLVARLRDQVFDLALLGRGGKLARHPLGGHDALVEERGDVRRGLAGDGHGRRQRAGVAGVERELVLAGPPHGDDGILHGIAGPDGVIPPHEALDREFPGILGVDLVGVGKADKAMQVSLLPLGDAADGKSAAVRNRFAIVRQPHQASMVAVVIDLQSDTHCDPPKIIAIIIILVVCGANGAPDA